MPIKSPALKFIALTLANVLISFNGFLPAALAIDVQGSISVPGNNTLDPDEEFDFGIVNRFAGETNTELVFSNSDPNGSNPFDATYSNCRQYIKLLFRSNRPEARLAIYTENTQTTAAPKFTGLNTTSDTTFHPTSAEASYDTEEPSGQRHNLTDMKLPVPVTGGIVGNVTLTQPDNTKTQEVVPIVWQIYDEVPSPFPVYNYTDPINPDMTRPIPYRNPTDWWAFLMDKYSLDWHFAVDFDEFIVKDGVKTKNPNWGHFKVDTNNGDPDHNDWIPTIGYRTVGTPFFNAKNTDAEDPEGGWDLSLGGFPGKRNTDGYRVDEFGAQLSYNEQGLPLDPSLATPEISANNAMYIVLAANFLGKHAQDFSSNKLIIDYSYFDGATLLPASQKRELPMRAIFQPGKEFGVTIKAKVAGEPTNQICFSNYGYKADGTCWNPLDGGPVTAVNARQYLEVTSASNIITGRFVMYADNAVADAVPRLDLTDRRDLNKSFTPTVAETTYRHPLPDNLGRRKLTDGRRPIPVTGGLVGMSDKGEVAPIVWQVYDNPDIDPVIAGTQYPNYNYSNPLSPEATDWWGFLMERFGWDWIWAVDYRDLDTSGHFKIAVDLNGKNGCRDEGGDPNYHCWIPTTGYRTIMDSFNNLGGFPGARDANDVRILGKLLQGTSPIYVFFGANLAGKHAQIYQTNKIILEFTE